MYAVQQDMVDRIGERRLVQLTDREVPITGAINTTRLARALSDAGDLIDSYLVGRVALPLANPPAVLKVHCCTIALYRLVGDQASELERKDYEDAIGWLTKIGTGAISLMPPAEAPVMGGLGSVLFDTGSKAFGRESL